MTSVQSDIFAVDPAVFSRNFDRRSIAFGHHLADHPLFAPERLLRLARELAQNPAAVYYDAGDVRIDQRWEDVPVTALSIDQLLGRIENAGAWIVLREAERDPEYAALLAACIDQIERLSGRALHKIIKVSHAIIFMNSPHRVSSYHIDRECNCLLQIRGTKTISIFDRDDRDVLPETELERFWSVDNNAAVYKPQYQDRGQTLELRPGSAVHIPVNAPHWVKNGDDVSVSLSISLIYHDHVLADVYRANYWLRRLGLAPLPPRRSRVIDGVKRSVYGSVRALGRAARVRPERFV